MDTPLDPIVPGSVPDPAPINPDPNAPKKTSHLYPAVGVLALVTILAILALNNHVSKASGPSGCYNLPLGNGWTCVDTNAGSAITVGPDVSLGLYHNETPIPAHGVIVVMVDADMHNGTGTDGKMTCSDNAGNTMVPAPMGDSTVNNLPSVVRGLNYWYVLDAKPMPNGGYRATCHFATTGDFADMDMSVTLFRQDSGLPSPGIDTFIPWNSGNSASGTCPCAMVPGGQDITVTQAGDLILGGGNMNGGYAKLDAPFVGVDGDFFYTGVAYFTAATTSSGPGTFHFNWYDDRPDDGRTSAVFALMGTAAQPSAPTIINQPSNQTVAVGQSATFSVAAAGTAPLSYQWQKNGSVILGATSSTYTTPVASLSDTGSVFNVVISNSLGTITSNSVTLTVNSATPPPAQPTFIQETSVVNGNGLGGSSTISLNQSTTAGNLLIISVTSDNQAASVNSITDTKGNTYKMAVPPTNWGSSGTEGRAEIWYANNIVGGPVTATVNLNAAANAIVQLYLSEYSGLDTVNPLDQISSHAQNGSVNTTFSSGAKTTASANEMIFGHCEMWSGSVLEGSGFVQHSTANGNIEETKNVTSIGSYDATCGENGSGPLAMMATFRAANNVLDTTPPTVSITGPVNGAAVSGTVTVSASATDNIGVAGVQFKLDGSNLGTEDTTSPYSTSWNTTATANGSHTLTAVVRDGSGNTTTSSSVAVNVSNAPAVLSLSLNPATVTGGSSSIGTVTLNGAAPTNTLITLTSSNTAAATVPASVNIAQGSSTATFTITSKPVSTNTNVTISAKSPTGTAKTAVLTVNRAMLSKMSLNPSTVPGKSLSTGTVTLDGPAPTSGFAVTLSTSNSSTATVPLSITVPAGATSANFIVTTKAVASTRSVTVTSKLSTTTKTSTLTVTP
jgi:hypothetical protein